MEKHCESEKRFGKEGNGKAPMSVVLDGFIRDSGSRAYQFAYSLAGNGEEAGELVQEALYRVMLAWDRYEASKPLDRWFTVILRNAFLDSRRRSGRKLGVSLDQPLRADSSTVLRDLVPDREPGVLEVLERKETAARACQALQGLKPRHRAVLVLRELRGLAYGDIAKSLRLPLGTVRSRIHGARQALRQTWRQLEA